MRTFLVAISTKSGARLEAIWRSDDLTASAESIADKIQALMAEADVMQFIDLIVRVDAIEFIKVREPS